MVEVVVVEDTGVDLLALTIFLSGDCGCESVSVSATLLESKNTHGHNNGFLVVSFCAHDLALSLQSRWQGFSVAFINFL